MNKIFFGPAGTGGSKLENFEAIKKAGCDSVEIEFVYGVWMSKQEAEKIRELNKKIGLKLSIHAPYYINLNSEDKTKIGASRSRILSCLSIANTLSNGEKISVVFHAGFYQKTSKEECYKKIKEQILRIIKEATEKGYKNAVLAPETTGKPSQFGDLDELLKLMKETGCEICIDFAHLKARYNGKINYDKIMDKLKNINQPIHSHFSGINYGEKGEKNHLLTEEKDIKELLTHLRKNNLNINIINESPNPLGDALKMKKIWGEVK
jgi:deoxyribonuclease-4